MTQEDFFYQCIDLIEQFFNGTRKMGDLQELTDKLYNEVTKPQWISVDDELPKDFKIAKDGFYAGEYEETDIVMVAFDDGDFGFARYVHDFPGAEEGEAWYWFGEGNLSGVSVNDGDITHWMPLPQAPTVAENATVKKGGNQ